MKILGEHYLLIGSYIGLTYLVITSLNLYFKFTKNGLFQGFLENETTKDLYWNLFVLFFTTIAISIIWPGAILVCLLYVWISRSEKKK